MPKTIYIICVEKWGFGLISLQVTGETKTAYYIDESTKKLIVGHDFDFEYFVHKSDLVHANLVDALSHLLGRIVKYRNDLWDQYYRLAELERDVILNLHEAKKTPPSYSPGITDNEQ